MSKKLQSLIAEVQDWAQAKGIYDKSTWEAQWLGVIAEVGEVADAIMRGDLDKAEMELGDVIVYYINYLTMLHGREPVYSRCSKDIYKFKNVERYTDIVVVMTTVLDQAGGCREGVAISLLCNHLQTTPEKALARAVAKITKRKGKMVGGKFVKDEQ